MDIKICRLDESDDYCKYWATQCVSLLDPKHQDLYRTTSVRHFEFFDDIAIQPTGYTGWILPTQQHIQNVFDYTYDLKDNDKLLVHCVAGISRSTAMALGILCQHESKPKDAIDRLYQIRNEMWPNSLVVKYCDRSLNLKGILISAVVQFKAKQDNVMLDLAKLPEVSNKDLLNE